LAVDGSLIFDTKIDTKGFKSGTNTIKTQADGLKSSLLGLGKVMVSVFAIKKLIDFGKQAIGTASDLQEVQNVVDTAFGDMSYKMEAFAKTSIETFGLSKLAAKQNGSTFMAMAKNMISSESAASDMAVTLTGLTGDWASFYNVSTGEAATALNGIFTGETEALKRYGYVLTEVNLQEYASQQGIVKKISAMTQEEKVLLRYNYMMEKSAMVQGDFAKTSDSWANQTRVLSERWKELLGILGTGLIQVLSPVVKYLNTALTSLISFATTVGNVMSSVFGLEKQSSGAAKATAAIGAGAENASSSLSDLGDSVKDTSKNINKNTASFDELNNMSESIASNSKSASDSLLDIGSASAAGTGETGETSGTISPSSIGLIKVALEPVIEAFGRLKLAMEPFKTFVAQGMTDFYNNLLLPLGTWVLGEGIPRFLDITASLFALDWPTLNQSLASLWTGLEKLGEFTFTALLDFYENFLLPVGKWAIGEGLPRFIDAIANGLAIINWTTINESLNSLWKALTPFALNIGEGLLWLWENVLVPFGTWTTNNVLPLFLDGLAAVFGILNGVIEALKPLALWLWESFLKPLAIWTGGLIVSILESIVEKLKAFSTWISENQSTVEGITIAIGAFFVAWEVTKLLSFIQMSGGLVGAFTSITTAIWACTGAKLIDKAETIYLTALYAKDFVVSIVSGTTALVKQAAQWVITTGLKIASTIATVAMTVATAAWNIMCGIATVVTAAFGAAVAFLTSPIGLVILAIAALIAIAILLIKNWDAIKEGASKCWEAIKTAWNNVSIWFNEKVVTPIKDFFSDLWKKLVTGATTALNSIKTTFKTIFDALVGIVKSPINLIIDIINGMVKGIVSGVNTVIKSINSINFKVPDWIPGIGGRSVGFNLSEISAPQIPRLATGTVIPPNSEFLAVLGDQKKGTNIEAPLDTIVEAFTQANSQNGGSGDINLNVYLDGKVIFKDVVKRDQEYQSMTGKSAFAH